MLNVKKPVKKLYKYTSLESLALILQSRKIRLNPLTKMDDLQEAKSSDLIKYAKYVFISSWIDQPKESIAMWKLYSNVYSGVRIGLRINPFEKYIVDEESASAVMPGASIHGEKAELILPIEDCFTHDYTLLNLNYDSTLETVIYTDNKELLEPKLFHMIPGGLEVKTPLLGKYKSTYWEFQNEKRYVLRFMPYDARKLVNDTNAAKTIYDAFMRNDLFFDYFDLKIRDDAFTDMEVMTSPQFTPGNRVILDALKETYNKGLSICESKLKGNIFLQ